MADEAKLSQLRKQIDEIDQELVALLNKRAEVAVEIGNAKQGAPIYRPERETQVLAQVAEANKGPIAEPGMALIFSVIMAACKDVQLAKRK